MRRSLAVAACGLALAIAAVLLVSPAPPLAAQSPAAQPAAVETKTFTIDNMTCALCPLTVKTAMEQVEGVRSVTIDFDTKTATVTFDPTATSPATIAAASTNAGYPARPAG